VREWRSGCGKTTALRLLAGLEDADAGRVVVAGKDLTRLSANKRNIGMVFQAYSLFPHMTALQNVAFGLRLRHVSSAERKKVASETLELVGLSAQSHRYAHQMSGGQQQRVALARALAIKPEVLLLDEPLSALDAKVRAQLRDEIRRVQLEVGTTTLFVTHDQEEALAIADRVGLSNRLAADVKGGMALVRGVAVPLVDPATPEGPAMAIVRPEAFSLAGHTDAESGPLVGHVIATAFLGAVSRISVDLGGGVTVLAQLPTGDAGAYPAGTRVRLALRPDPVLVNPMRAAEE
jgi:putative spermidine/putrescine transport system ATP-binding protein